MTDIEKLVKAIGTNTEAIGVLTKIVQVQTSDIRILHERLTELERASPAGSWWQRVFGGAE